MTTFSQSDRQFWRLIDNSCNGPLTEVEIRELEAYLTHSALRQLYLDHCRLHAELSLLTCERQALDGLVEVLLSEPPKVELAHRPERVGIPSYRSLTFSLACLIVVAAFWTFWAYLIRPDQSNVSNRAVASRVGQPIATLHATSNCTWISAGESFTPGKRLNPGQLLCLVDGVAEIEFADGAMVVLDGPTTFVVEASGRGRLDRGKLVAKVPPRAIGFTIATPKTEIVDFGTEFAVEVDADQAAHVEVFVGFVELSAQRAGGNADEPKTRLSAGQAVRFNATSRSFEPALPISRHFTHSVQQYANSHPTRSNLALGKPASQSSSSRGTFQDEPLTADKAVDGRFGSFTHTELDDPDVWWQVDLEQSATIDSVILYNRADAAGGRLRDITITILREDNTVVAVSNVLNEENYLGGGQEDFINGPPALVWQPDKAQGNVIGRYVRVSRQPIAKDPAVAMPSDADERISRSYNRHVLALGEVRVMGAFLDESKSDDTK